MNDHIQKRFPAIRWALCCLLGSAWALLVFSGINGVFEYPADQSDRQVIISFIFLAYLIALPNPKRENGASVWNKPLSSFSSSDITLNFIVTILLWGSLLVTLCAALWAVGEEGLKRIIDSYVVQISIWMYILASTTIRCLNWQKQ